MDFSLCLKGTVPIRGLIRMINQGTRRRGFISAYGPRATAALGLFLSVMCSAVADDRTDFVSASSEFPGGFFAYHAVDADPATRWASDGAPEDTHLHIDLGEAVELGALRLAWETAYAREYAVYGSDNARDWNLLHHARDGKGGEETIVGLDEPVRHVRIAFLTPGPFGLYSLWEISFEGRQAAQALERRRQQWRDHKYQREAASLAALHRALREVGVREVVFSDRALHLDGHWYANFGYYVENPDRKTYVYGSGLHILEVMTGGMRTLIDDPQGTLRDPAVHYDGETILFSWRKGGTETFHLYTIRSDGSGLTQLTNGEYDDIEPAWLPDGGIVFVSSRCRRWVNCWVTQVATVHRCDADGGNIRPLSANLEHDNTPWPLPDGRILYTRWEYIDRSQVDYHHLWTMNPDGTGQTVFFGNMHPGDLYIGAKPIPETGEILFVNSPGHGLREHVGKIAIVHDKLGPDHLPALRNISGNGYRDPFPLTENVFMAARGAEIVLMDRNGVTDTLFRFPETPDRREVHEPRPLLPRAREPIIPSRVDYAKTTGNLLLSDAYLGRNMEGVAPGDIAKLLVVESLPKPVNFTGGMDPLSYGGTFTLERILGEVPVEPDGSAYFEVPAKRSLFLIALDAQNLTVKRMQSFLSVMPGETLGCVGCHEERVQAAPLSLARRVPEALKRPPSTIQPIPGIPEVFDFPRDIQPILDKHCVSCHDYVRHPGAAHGPRAGNVVLAGDRGPLFSHSYVTLTVLGQFADGRNRAQSNYPPRAIGAVASPLMHKVLDGHHGVALSPEEIDMIRYWIETGAPYPGTYGALGAGAIGGYQAYLDNEQALETDFDWPTTTPATEAIDRRCTACHQGDLSLPTALSDENDLSFWRPEWDDPRLKRSRHLMFNLSRPQLSLMLLAPLSKDAGGYGICRATGPAEQASAVFQSTDDEDYMRILAMIAAGKQRLEEIKRFDMPGYRPPEPYLREMVRYGILESIPPKNTPVDTYDLDRRYWASFDAGVVLQHDAYRVP